MNSDNELDSGSEDENENREMENGNKKLDAEFTPVATEENEVEYLVEGTLANCGEENSTKQTVGVGIHVDPIQMTPFIASEIKEELHTEKLLPKEQLTATEEGVGNEKQRNICITPQHFLSQLLGDQMESLPMGPRGDNIEAELGEEGKSRSGLEGNVATTGSINLTVMDADATNIGKDSVRADVLEKEVEQKDDCPLCAEAGEVFSAGQNEMATHFVQVNWLHFGPGVSIISK